MNFKDLFVQLPVISEEMENRDCSVQNEGYCYPGIPYFVDDLGYQNIKPSQLAVDNAYLYNNKSATDICKRRYLAGIELKYLKDKAYFQENIRLHKKNEMFKPIQTSDGEFCIEINTPDGKKFKTANLTDARDLKLKILHGAGKDIRNSVCKLFWDKAPNGVTFLADYLVEKRFFRRMRYFGLYFYKSPFFTITELEKAILDFLIQNAEFEEIPETCGWTKNSKGLWQYTEAGRINLADERRKYA